MFVSEPIVPEPGSFDTTLMRQGLASLPAAFTWRGRRYVIGEVLSHVKVSTPEGGRAGGEMYLRRQQFVVRLDTGAYAKVYVERQSRRGRAGGARSRRRWYLYALADSPDRL